jgi:hypothetical protein
MIDPYVLYEGAHVPTAVWKYGNLEVDASLGSVAVVRRIGPVSDEDFTRYLEDSEHNMKVTPHKMVTIILGKGSIMAPPTQRKIQAEWLKRNSDLLAQSSLGSCFVVDSAAVRGALTAIFWFVSMPTDYKIVSTMKEAVAWCKQQLQAAGVEIPANIDALAATKE